MRSNNPHNPFEDILANISRIQEHTAGMDLTALLENPKTYDAVERCLERISEASKRLGALAEELCPDIPWPKFALWEMSCGMNTKE